MKKIAEITEFFKVKTFYQICVASSIHNLFCEHFLDILLIIVLKNV